MVVRETTEKEKTTVGIRCYISNLLPNAKKMSELVRSHWGIENGLHWQLDVSFNEDLNRARKDNAQANLGVVRRIALSMIKNTPNLNGSVSTKRLMACCTEQSIEAIVFGTKV